MKASPELREKMWELCYDLLPEGERSALIAQIKSDPHAARLYAEVRLQADLVGYAATVDDPSLILTADAEKLKSADLAPAGGRRKEAAQGAAASAGKAASGSLWAANASAIAAGLALALLIGVGFFRPQGQNAAVAQLIRTVVEVPGQLMPGLTNEIAIRTASSAGQPIAVPVDVKIVDQLGQVQFQETIETSDEGWARVELLGQAIQPGSRIQVEARGERFDQRQDAQQADQISPPSANFVQAELPVARLEPLTHYWLEKPVAAAGENLRMAVVAFDRFGSNLQPPPTGEVVVKQENQVQRVQPQWSVHDNLADGTVQLAAQDRELFSKAVQESDRERRLALIEVEQAHDALPAQLERSESRMKAVAEGTTRLQSELRPDTLSAARAAAPTLQESAPQAAVPALAATGDEGVKETAKAKEAVSGKDPTNRFADEKDIAGQGNASQGGARQSVASQGVPERPGSSSLAKGLGGESASLAREMLSAGGPVEVELPAEQAGKELEAIVRARDTEVIRQKVKSTVERFVQGNEQRESFKVTLKIPPEVDGKLDVKLVDPADQYKVVVERQLYRLPARQFVIEPLNRKERYEPGELVQLQFKVVNEHGEPAAGTPAVIRVWNDEFVPDDPRELKMLADVVRELDTSAPSAVQLAMQPGASQPGDADKLGVDQLAGYGRSLRSVQPPPQPAGAAAPLPAGEPAGQPAEPQVAITDSQARDALQPAEVNKLEEMAEGSGTAAAAPVAAYFDISQPLKIASNESAIDRQLQSLKGERDRAAAAWRATMGRVLVGGGLVALAVLGLLFVLKQQVRWSSGTLALVASATSLVIGAAWISGDRQAMTVAMSQSRGDRALAKTELAKTAPAPHDPDAAVLDDTTVLGMAPAADTFGAYQPPLPSATEPAAATAAAPLAAPENSPQPTDSGEAGRDPAKTSLAFGVPPAIVTEEGKDAAGSKKFAEGAAGDAPAGRGMKPGEKQVPGGRGGKAVDPKSGSAAGGFGGGELRRGTLETTHPADASRDGAAGGQAAPAAPAAPATAATPKPPRPSPPPPAPKADYAPVDRRRSNAVEDNAVDGKATEDKAEVEKLAGVAAAPSSIYFNPQLTTDANGIVTLEFRLPSVASEYRVLLDAYGNGRVGSSADVRIICRTAK